MLKCSFHVLTYVTLQGKVAAFNTYTDILYYFYSTAYQKFTM